jgi:hypothetical protein
MEGSLCHINCYGSAAKIRYGSLTTERATQFRFSDKLTLTLTKLINGLIHASLKQIFVTVDMRGAHQTFSGSAKFREYWSVKKPALRIDTFFLSFLRIIHVGPYRMDRDDRPD